MINQMLYSSYGLYSKLDRQNTHKKTIKYRTSESDKDFTFGGYRLKERGH